MTVHTMVWSVWYLPKSGDSGKWFGVVAEQNLNLPSSNFSSKSYYSSCSHVQYTGGGSVNKQYIDSDATLVAVRY